MTHEQNNKNIPDYNKGETIVGGIIQHLLSRTGEEIHKLQLLKNLPAAIHHQTMNETYSMFHAMNMPHAHPPPNSMEEEHVESIPLLVKDSLMPRMVERQGIEQFDKMSVDMAQNTKSRRKVLFGTKSSFKNKSMMNATNKTSNLSVSSRKRKKQRDELFISISVKEKDDEDDPEVAHLWRTKDLEIKQGEKVRKMQEQRIKVFQQKKQNFIEEFNEKQYTFDFEGAPVTYRQNEQKINYHSMKMKLGHMQKRKKEGQLHKTGDIVRQVKPISKKPSIVVESSPKSEEFSLNIPVFDSSTDTGVLFGINTEVNRYRLKQYKKHNGGRFTRLEKSLNTIDVGSEKPDEFQSIFSEKRHFRDEESLNQSIASYRSREGQGTRRKLALPKIKGKYSTLDRYEGS